MAEQTIGAGGHAQAHVVDAQDEQAVEDLFQQIASDGHPIDISFTAVGPLASQYSNGTHAVDLRVDDFMVSLTGVVRTNFIIARAAARRMVQQRSGTILFLTGSPARGHVPGATAIGTAFGGLESLMENLAVELGPVGVRVLCLRTTVNIDTRTIQDTLDILARQMNVTKGQMISTMAGLNFLKSPASTGDTAKAAAFLASGRARMMTGTVVNSTAGAALD